MRNRLPADGRRTQAQAEKQSSDEPVEERTRSCTTHAKPKNMNIMPLDPSDPCHVNKPRDGDDLFFRTSSDLSPPTPNNSTGKIVSRPLIRAYSLNSTGSIMRIPTLSESLHTPYGDRSRSRSAHFGPGGRRKCHSDSDMYASPRAGGVRFDRVEIREYNRAVGE